MGDVNGLLSIIPLESNDYGKGKVYHAHGTLRPFMTELVVSLSSSKHDSSL